VLAKTGGITWAGPALCEGFGVQEPDDIMEACFDDLLLAQGEGSGWRQLTERRQGVAGIEASAASVLTDNIKTAFSIKDSVLWGGNLTVLTSLLGTPYFPDIKGGTLFLEDVGEHPYRIERMLTQLLHAGVLARQKAILFGQFTDYTLVSHDRGFKFQTVIDTLRQKLHTRILTNLPYGHVQTKVLLPVGAKIDLAVDGRDVLLAWGHL
jgi:muramoyltetrapeptide carboxypeptidase